VGRGVHQGTVLAPFFANVVMCDWDKQWVENVPLFRYVDDWLVLADNRPTIERLAEEMRAALPTGVICHLENKDKCLFIEPENEIEFLGLSVSPSCEVRPCRKSFEAFDARIEKIAADASSVVEAVVKMQRYSEAWKAYYSQAGLSQERKRHTDNVVKKAVDGWLARNGLNSVSNCGKFRNLLLQYRPNSDKKVAQRIKFAVESGETKPTEIEELLTNLC